jgi:L-2-hydroxyglutarate oxidase
MASIRMEADYLIIGSGIVGLAVAWRLRNRGRVVVVDKEPTAAFHQTGRNSGVLHSGIYYAPGSYKAKLCVEGREQMESFASDHGIPLRTPGKLILATDWREAETLDVLAVRGEQNGLSGLRQLSSTELASVEPAVRGIGGLLVPQTGLIDYRQVAAAMARDIDEAGGELLYGFEVIDIKSTLRPTVSASDGRVIVANAAVNCGGLQADRVARLAGVVPNVQIVPFRGIYYRIAVPGLVSHPVYPVPDLRFPFLGVHVTPTVAGEIEAGPNAVLATGREAYRLSDVDWGDMLETIRYPGFRHFAREHWRVGAVEVRRTLSRHAFGDAIRQLLPDVQDSWLIRSGSGIRAQALDRRGNLVDDFVFERTDNLLHVLNAPSPAATAALAIGESIANRL